MLNPRKVELLIPKKIDKNSTNKHKPKKGNMRNKRKMGCIGAAKV